MTDREARLFWQGHMSTVEGRKAVLVMLKNAPCIISLPELDGERAEDFDIDIFIDGAAVSLPDYRRKPNEPPLVSPDTK